MAGIFPAVLMILMAASIKSTLEEAQVLDTILHGAVGLAQVMPKWAVILFIYLIVLVMNFFISSQLSILAFAFGDGFSNVFYPTNAALLIGLGVADVGY